MIEKGYAKLNGTYQSLIGGNLDEALVNLNGKPAVQISNDKDYR